MKAQRSHNRHLAFQAILHNPWVSSPLAVRITTLVLPRKPSPMAQVTLHQCPLYPIIWKRKRLIHTLALRA